MNVFVVDDDPAFLERVKRSLAPRGANVFAHLGWRGSLFAARGAKPDVVLLDLNMPGLSGTWLLAELRKQCPRARILFCSDSEPSTLKRIAKAVGADGAISKAKLNKLGADDLRAMMGKETQ